MSSSHRTIPVPDTALKCAVACGNSASCNYWTLKNNQSCYLFDTLNIGLQSERIKMENYTSGNRQCAHGGRGGMYNVSNKENNVFKDGIGV